MATPEQDGDAVMAQGGGEEAPPAPQAEIAAEKAVAKVKYNEFLKFFEEACYQKASCPTLLVALRSDTKLRRDAQRGAM